MNRITRIEVDKDGDCTFFFDESDEPFSSTEFNRSTETRTILEVLESIIEKFNESR